MIPAVVMSVIALALIGFAWYGQWSARKQPLQPFKVENTWERR